MSSGKSSSRKDPGPVLQKKFSFVENDRAGEPFPALRGSYNTRARRKNGRAAPARLVCVFYGRPNFVIIKISDRE